MNDSTRAAIATVFAIIFAIVGTYLLAFKSGLSDSIQTFIVMAPMCIITVIILVMVYNSRCNTPEPPSPPELPEDIDYVEGEIID